MPPQANAPDPSAETYYQYCANTEEEYRSLLATKTGEIEDDDERIRKLLREVSWSERGAEALVLLARQYGSFVLRHALALARVMDIEDGELGI